MDGGVGDLTVAAAAVRTHVGLQDHDAFIEHSVCSKMEGLGARWRALEKCVVRESRWLVQIS